MELDQQVEQNTQEHQSNSHYVIKISKKTAYIAGIFIAILCIGIISIDSISQSLLRTFPQLNPLANDVPEVTVVEEYSDLSSGSNTQEVLSPAIKLTEETTMNSTYIDLYGLSVELPTRWTLTEINRRPEPSEMPNLVRGHDCADYEIEDPEGTIKITFQFICGFGDGGGLELPPTAVKLTEQNNEGIARIVEGDNIKYVDYGPVKISDLEGTRTEDYYSNIISFDSSTDNNLVGTATAIYLGEESEFQHIIQSVDNIILSVVK